MSFLKSPLTNHNSVSDYTNKKIKKTLTCYYNLTSSEMTSTTVNSGTAVISPAGPGDAPGMNVSRSASNPSVWEVQTNTRKQAGTSGCCET